MDAIKTHLHIKDDKGMAQTGSNLPTSIKNVLNRSSFAYFCNQFLPGLPAVIDKAPAVFSYGFIKTKGGKKQNIWITP